MSSAYPFIKYLGGNLARHSVASLFGVDRWTMDHCIKKSFILRYFLVKHKTQVMNDVFV